MNYISADRFLGLDKKVQDKIIRWWEPKVGDLYANIKEFDAQFVVVVLREERAFTISLAKELGDCIPVLTETQLRTYIENTIKGGVNIYSDTEGYTMKVETEDGKWLFSSSTDLLECYLDISVKVS